jgi:hypothetical protein
MMKGKLMGRHEQTGKLWLCLVSIILALLVCPVFGQDAPPEKGGFTSALGLPPIYKGHAGFEMQWYYPGDHGQLGGLGSLGLHRDFGSPVVGIAALGVEAYGGWRASKLDGGGRALFTIPSFGISTGVDYNLLDEDLHFLLQLDLPIRRSGVFGRGSVVSLRWLPARGQTWGAGVTVPLWGSNVGKTRPQRDHVRLDERKPKRFELAQTDPELVELLNTMRERAQWIARLSQPFSEYSGGDPVEAMEPTLTELKEHMAQTDAQFPHGHTISEEIRIYHESLERAFAVAFRGTSLDNTEISKLSDTISAVARRILLDEILLPYNSLLGQRKKNDDLLGLVAVAQTEFGRWLLVNPAISDEQARKLFYVFQTLCDVMEENRRELRKRWEDTRFVWLPLQYGLKPEEHDSQRELNNIVERAVRAKFSQANRVWYVINEEFQLEMANSVRRADDYHVLWIHDYRGVDDDGNPDEISYAHVLNYLEALIERVNLYDQTGKLPIYMIFLDQHYFELNKSRVWLRLLREPLDHKISLPSGYEVWEDSLSHTQERLRKAVANSDLLRLQEGQYGLKWLKNQIRVHVNVTNPADHSFRSFHSMGILPIPDNMMRDHRKIAFYDITEADPYRGMVMFTGMGIGSHYVGANWEDRAIMLKGPEALAVKDAARGLLLTQGFEKDEIPYPLRPVPFSTDYNQIIQDSLKTRLFTRRAIDSRVLQLHNETGFRPKPVNVARAVLFSLMPGGSVMTIPCSLWQSYIDASLLAGNALNGCRILVISPTKNSAPSGAGPTLARNHGLMGRLIAFSNLMESELEEAGGLLKVGLYSPRQGVGDLDGRLKQAREMTVPWINRIYPSNPEVDRVVRDAPKILDSLGYSEAYLTGEKGAVMVNPKLHLKANFLASRTAWESLSTHPGLAKVIHWYIAYLAQQNTYSGESEYRPGVQNYPIELEQASLELFNDLNDEMSDEDYEKAIFYLSVGSTNMDYRSMVMDGEVMLILSSWQSLLGFLDFLLLPGLCEWIESQEELNELLPPPGGFTRRMSDFMKLSL